MVKRRRQIPAVGSTRDTGQLHHCDRRTRGSAFLYGRARARSDGVDGKACSREIILSNGIDRSAARRQNYMAVRTHARSPARRHITELYGVCTESHFFESSPLRFDIKHSAINPGFFTLNRCTRFPSELLLFPTDIA